MKKKVVLILLIALFITVGCGKSSNKEESKKKEEKKEEVVKIKAAETSKIEYEDYDNGLVKLKIPKGWKVYIPKIVTYSGYSFRVYNPEKADIG